MTARGWINVGAAVTLLVLAAWIGRPELVAALQIGFVAAGAAPIGAVLLLAIARLTGAEWRALVPLVRPLPVLAPIAAVALLAGGGVALPPHLAIWQHPLFAAVRGVVTVAALAFAGARLARGASATFAAVTLALYAALVTPVATDWLLATAPGHAVSAIGMMLAVGQIGAASAAALALGIGGERLRQDLAKLLVASALGLCYLTFMDYLIIWFGNLPSRVPFYVARGTPEMAGLVVVAFACGLVAPIALLTLRPGERGRRWAGACALAGLVLFDGWWIGGGLVAALLGLIATMLVARLLFAFVALRPAHG